VDEDGFVGGGWDISSVELSLPFVVVLHVRDVGVGGGEIKGLGLRFGHLRFRTFFWFVIGGFRHRFCVELFEDLVLLVVFGGSGLLLMSLGQTDGLGLIGDSYLFVKC